MVCMYIEAIMIHFDAVSMSACTGMPSHVSSILIFKSESENIPFRFLTLLFLLQRKPTLMVAPKFK